MTPYWSAFVNRIEAVIWLPKPNELSFSMLRRAGELNAQLIVAGRAG